MSQFQSHSIVMQQCVTVAKTLRQHGETLNFIKHHLRRGFSLLPENAIVKAVALARFRTEANYKQIKLHKRAQRVFQLSTPTRGR